MGLIDFQPIADQIAVSTGRVFKLIAAHPLGGGDINRAFHLQGDSISYFVKLNQPSLLQMFAAEFASLQALAATATLKIPQPIVFGQTAECAFLVLELITFGRSSAASERQLGQQLAQLHGQPQAYFGWHCQNTIGSTPQINLPQANWLDFWREHRLGFQLQLAAQNGYGGQLQSKGQRLMADLAVLFKGYQPQPALLHGDLWGGNAAVDLQGNPVIFDPACYFGDREADVAMTELFGGFGQDFYAAYREAWALDQGYGTRKTLYNLYHILNHLNLFGSGYLAQAERMVEQLLAEMA